MCGHPEAAQRSEALTVPSLVDQSGSEFFIRSSNDCYMRRSAIQNSRDVFLEGQAFCVSEDGCVIG
jgi:hypothetical protein